MLVSFSLKNWKSYKEESELNMVADRSRQYTQTLASNPYYRGLKILPVAAVYGGNAAGKSNLFSALRYVQNFVTNGEINSFTTGVQPFLSKEGRKDPTSFSIKILVKQPKNIKNLNPSRGSKQTELIYQLDFKLNQVQVLSESLSWYNSMQEKQQLYSRNAGGTVIFSDKVKDFIGDDYILLEACAKGTGPRRLFLTNTVNQQLSIFQPVYDWFKNYLRTADNSTEYLGVGPLMNDQTYCDHFSDILKSLDTGIEDVKLESVDSSALGLPPQILGEIASSIGKNSMVQLVNHAQGEIAPLQIFIISKKTKDNQDNEENNIEDNNLLIQRVQTYRRGLPLGFNNESTGTRRLFELLPIFLSLWNNEPCVWILDEVEREFHTGLTRKILQEFLNSCAENTRTQVLINTHDLMLMDQDIFRKDEILITERDRKGVSHLISLGEFAGIRNDLDLRNSYLEGRFGGLPEFDDTAFEEAVEDFSLQAKEQSSLKPEADKPDERGEKEGC